MKIICKLVRFCCVVLLFVAELSSYAEVTVLAEGSFDKPEVNVDVSGAVNSKSTFTLTGLKGYNSEEMKKAISMGLFVDYITGLSSANVVGNAASFGVDDRFIDTNEALMLKVSDIDDGESMFVRRVTTRQYSRDDSSDVIVYDFSANQVVFSKFDRQGAGSNIIEFGDLALEQGDIILLASGVSGSPSWRINEIDADVGTSIGKTHQDRVSADSDVSTKEYYYTGIDGQQHIIKVYFPKKRGAGKKAPCAIFFHGGGWGGGSHQQFRYICAYLASRGMVSITADYSLTTAEVRKDLPEGQSRKRNCVIDGKTVIRWIKKNAKELGVDTGRMVAGGGSAGGHISALSVVDTNFNNPEDPKGISTELQGLLMFCPAFVVLERDRTPEVNVFKNLDRPFPPSLFLLGETDGWKTASDSLIKELRARNVDLEAWMAKGKGHMFFLKDPWLTLCLQKVDSFLVKRGILGGKSKLVAPKSGEQLTQL